MPKTTNTRKQKAKDLLETAIRGPKFFDMGSKPFTVEKAKAQYELWSSSWIIPRLKELVPELRDKKPLCPFLIRSKPEFENILSIAHFLLDMRL